MKQAGITKRGAGQSTATSLWGDSMSRDRRGPDTDSAGVAEWMDSVRRMADFSGTRRGAYPGRATAARACAGADAATAKGISIGFGKCTDGGALRMAREERVNRDMTWRAQENRDEYCALLLRGRERRVDLECSSSTKKT